jgi:uncharacterized protein YutE (UPF0331/DUF86 family)
MSRINIELLQRKIKLLEEDLAKLKDYREISLDEYSKNQETQLVVERLLEKITGRLIDLNYHILKEEYGTMPEDYYSSFIEIGKNKVVSEEFAKEIAKSVGLRNALAHEYEEINQKMVFESINTALIQVPKYLQNIMKLF